jgi:hypothetical protein
LVEDEKFGARGGASRYLGGKKGIVSVGHDDGDVFGAGVSWKPCRKTHHASQKVFGEVLGTSPLARRAVRILSNVRKCVGERPCHDIGE